MKDEIVLYSNPAFGGSNKPICVIRFDGKRFTIHARNSSVASKYEARIKMSPAWSDFGKRPEILSSYLSSTFGPLVRSSFSKHLSKEDIVDALSAMKFKMSFDYDAKLSLEERRKNAQLQQLAKKIPMLRNVPNEKRKRKP